MNQQNETPTEIQEKLKPFENMTIDSIRGNVRLEDESYKDYILRREVEQLFIERHLQGIPITKYEGKNRKATRQMYKEYNKQERYKIMQEQKKQREIKMCPRCHKKFLKCNLQEHMEIHKRKVDAS